MSEILSVKFDAAGTHKFHMEHINKSGGPELVLKVLTAAGLHVPPQYWRVIVQKKINCSGETPPIRVTGWERGQVILKLKPGNSHSCHQVALVMPSGMKAHEVYHKLRGVASSFDTHWRTTPIIQQIALLGVPIGEQEVPVPNTLTDIPEVPPVPAEPTSQQPVATSAPSSVKGITGDLTRIREALLGIHQVSQQEFSSQLAFVEALAARMNWGEVGPQRHSISGLFASLNRRRYIESVKHCGLASGYKLTHSGLVFIRDLLPPDSHIPDLQPEVAAPPPVSSALVPLPQVPEGVTITLPVMTIDPIQLLMDMGLFAQRLAEVAIKLKKNREERQEYQDVVDRLDAEAAELMTPFQAKEQQLLLQMLIDRFPTPNGTLEQTQPEATPVV